MEIMWIGIIASVCVVILIVSLYVLLKKKEIIIEEEKELVEEFIAAEELFVDRSVVETLDEKLTEDKEEVKEIKNKKEKLVKINREPIKNSKEKLKDDSKLSISISSKTEQNLLNKLADFEKSKGYLNKEVNLSFLAKKFNTNTKYLSEIIKSYKNKNFNQYLNELRIDYLIEQLHSDEKVLNTKVSYLAGDFGFNSHSSFSTIFTQYIGKSPSDYIKELKLNKNE